LRQSSYIVSIDMETLRGRPFLAARPRHRRIFISNQNAAWNTQNTIA